MPPGRSAAITMLVQPARHICHVKVSEMDELCPCSMNSKGINGQTQDCLGVLGKLWLWNLPSILPRLKAQFAVKPNGELGVLEQTRGVRALQDGCSGRTSTPCDQALQTALLRPEKLPVPQDFQTDTVLKSSIKLTCLRQRIF